MIILNDKEMKSKYTIENKLLVFRNKGKDIKDLYEDVLNDNDLSDYFKECYSIGQESIDMSKVEFKGLTKENMSQEKTGIYTKIYSEDEYLSLRTTLRTYVRPSEFVGFEKFLFNQSTPYTFTERELPSKEELLDEIQAAAGILPTLWHLDLTYEEKKNLSMAGENIIRHLPQEIISIDNPLPEKADIDRYIALTSQEKKLINRGRINPRQLFDLMKYVKIEGKNNKGEDIISSRLITKELVEQLEQTDKFSIRAIGDQVKAPKYPEIVERITPMFQKEYGRAPMVVNEYVEGQLHYRGLTSIPNLSDEILNEIVKDFNRKNVQLVAKYRSPSLFALDTELNFGELKDNIIETLGVYIPVEKVKYLKDKGFFEYLKAHKDLSVTEVENLIERGLSRVNQIKSYTLNKTPSELINAALCEAGDRARISYEKEYGYKFEDNEISIKGRHLCVTEGKKKIYILPKDDLRNFIVGDEKAGGTACCQHYGGAGESCVWKVTEDPFAANVIIEVNGQIQAQAFVWTDEQNKTFVFDNFEYKNDGNANGYMNLIGNFVAALPYPNVHIGMGYTEGTAWNGVGMLVCELNKSKHAKMPTTRQNRSHVYSDYHPTYNNTSGAKALKVDGKMVKFFINPSSCKIETKPDEPTKFDMLATDEYSFLCNDYKRSVEDRIAWINEFKTNPTDDKLIDLFSHNPAAISAFDNLSDAVQDHIVEKHPEYIESIKNPNLKTIGVIIERNPHKLFDYPNPPEELVLRALEQDGMLIKKLAKSDITPKMCETAVKQNGYAYLYLPEDMRNNSLKRQAIKTSPKLITKVEHDSSLIRLAIDTDKNVFYLINNATDADKVYAINRNPGLINSIKEPSEELVRQAVSLNGLLIRNFQKEYPELRTVAIEQNPYAIRVLHGLTKDEAMLALSINSSVATAIKSSDLREELGLPPLSNPFEALFNQGQDNIQEDYASVQSTDDTFGIDIETI